MSPHAMQQSLSTLATNARALIDALTPKPRASTDSPPPTVAEIQAIERTIVTNVRSLRATFDSAIAELEALAASAEANLSGPEAA